MKQNIIHVDECECYLDGDKGIVVAPCGPEKNAIQVYQELTSENARLKAENARLQEETNYWKRLTESAIESALEYTSAGHEVAGIGSEMVDDGVSLDHAGRVVDNITDEYELGG